MRMTVLPSTRSSPSGGEMAPHTTDQNTTQAVRRTTTRYECEFQVRHPHGQFTQKIQV